MFNTLKLLRQQQTRAVKINFNTCIFHKSLHKTANNNYMNNNTTTSSNSQQPSCDVCHIGNKDSCSVAAPQVTSIPDELRSYNIIGENGKNLKFENLFSSQNALVVFMRHFNCYVCRDFISELTKKINFEDFDKQNINFYVVGCSDNKGMQSFLKEVPFPASRLVTDPERLSYKHLGLVQAKDFKELKGNGEGPKAKETTSSLLGGFGWSLWKQITQGNRGNVYQLGGCYVFEKQTGKVLFSQIDSNAVQHVSIEQIKDIAQKYGTNKQ